MSSPYTFYLSYQIKKYDKSYIGKYNHRKTPITATRIKIIK